MGFGGSKSSSPKKGADGQPLPTVTSVTPTAGNPIPRQSVAVQEKLSEPQKAASLLQEDDEKLKKGLA